MARLPVVFGDSYKWGPILNEFLRVAHNDDGTLKSLVVDGFPSGTVMLFRQAVAPAAWTRVVDAANTDAVIIVRLNNEVPGSGGSWTISGLTNAAPVLTMDAYTPAGTVSQPTFTGNAMAAHQHDAPMAQTGNDVVIQTANPYGTGGNLTGDRIFTSAAGPGGLIPTLRVSSVSAGTPSGTVSQPTFTGSAVAPTGTVSTPAISSSGAWRPKYIEVISASKD